MSQGYSAENEHGCGQQNLAGQGLEEGQQQRPPQSHSRQPVLVPPKRAPPRRIDHTYRDYSKFPLSELPARKKAPTNFPSKLHHILSTHAFSHIVSWMPHGRAWKIHNKELLVHQVISKYFDQSKYESFTRQLNGWGYKRLHQSGNDFNAYYHPCFLRGLPNLTVLMSRLQPNKGKLLPNVEGEPNFYEIEKEFPLPPPPMAPYPGGPGDYNGPLEPPIRAPLDLSVGGVYYTQHYSSYPSNYPHPPPHHGHHGDNRGLSPYYTSQSSHPHYSHYPPAQHSHPPPQQSTHYSGPPAPGPPYDSLSRYNYPTQHNMFPVKSEEVYSQRAVREEIFKDKSEDFIEPLSIFAAESANNTTRTGTGDIGKDLGEDRQTYEG